MTELARTLRAFRGLSEALREAVAESKLAYELNANSYSYSCLSACLAAERALEVLRAAIEESYLTERATEPPRRPEADISGGGKQNAELVIHERHHHRA
jgi:hypothetical protein